MVCPDHNFDATYNCVKCDEQKQLITDFQNHHHTFTCRKKKKGIVVQPYEGHGKLDGIIEGPKLSDITDCRFRFPQFPMNQTKLILGVPKDLDKDTIDCYEENDSGLMVGLD